MIRTLIIFAREPSDPQAKTRLAPILTDAHRAQLVEAMLLDVLDAASAAQSDERILYWAAERQPERLRAIVPGWLLMHQSGADLGVRMLNALRPALGSGDEDDAAVLIGSDAPLLTAQHIDAAFDRLREADVVLGPSFDGGYYLIGARSRVRANLHRLFAGIPWSTPEVLETTCGRIAAIRQEADLTLALLPVLDDVDTPDDLRRVRAQLYALTTASQPVPKRTAAFLLEPPE